MRSAVGTHPDHRRWIGTALVVLGLGMLLSTGAPIRQDGPIEPARADLPRTEGPPTEPPRAFTTPPRAVDAAVGESPHDVLAIAEDIGRRFNVKTGTALSISSAIFAAAQSQGIQPALVLAIVAVESRYRTNAINRQSGAVGLMQILPRFHPEMVNAVGGEKQLLQIAPNIQVGSQIIAECLDHAGGNVKDALGRYLGVAGAEIYLGRVRDLMRHFDKIIANAEPG